MKMAIIVIDMINDFVKGKFGSKRSQSIIPNIAKLLERAREKEIPIIYLCDSHLENDRELKIWGPHALKDTEGAKIISELKPERGNIIINKNHYSGFINDTLYLFLRAFDADTLIFVGVSTDICVQINVGYAYHMGYRLIVLSDCTASIDEESHEYALRYMKNIYGAEIMMSDELEMMQT